MHCNMQAFSMAKIQILSETLDSSCCSQVWSSIQKAPVRVCCDSLPIVVKSFACVFLFGKQLFAKFQGFKPPWTQRGPLNRKSNSWNADLRRYEYELFWADFAWDLISACCNCNLIQKSLAEMSCHALSFHCLDCPRCWAGWDNLCISHLLHDCVLCNMEYSCQQLGTSALSALIPQYRTQFIGCNTSYTNRPASGELVFRTSKLCKASKRKSFSKRGNACSKNLTRGLPPVDTAYRSQKFQVLQSYMTGSDLNKKILSLSKFSSWSFSNWTWLEGCWHQESIFAIMYTWMSYAEKLLQDQTFEGQKKES